GADSRDPASAAGVVRVGGRAGARSYTAARGVALSRVPPMRKLATPVAVAVAITLMGAGGSDRTTLRPFIGTWIGHTRGLTVDRTGLAKEFISDGCCDLVIRLTTRLSRPRRVGGSIVATATVVRARIYDRSAFRSGHAPPHVGERGRFTLRRGIITERLTGTTYCNARASRLGRCGA